MPDENQEDGPIGEGSTTLDYLLHKYPWLRVYLKEPRVGEKDNTFVLTRPETHAVGRAVWRAMTHPDTKYCDRRLLPKLRQVFDEACRINPSPDQATVAAPASDTAFLIEMDAKEAVSVEGSLRTVAEFGGSFGVSLEERARCNRVAARIKLALDRAATVVAAHDQEDKTDGKG